MTATSGHPWHESMDEEGAAHAFDTVLTHPHSFGLVALEGDTVIGVILGHQITQAELTQHLDTEITLSDHEDVAYLAHLAVHPDHHEAGLSHLHDAWLVWAREHHLHHSLVESLAEPLHPLHTWLEGHGYHEVGHASHHHAHLVLAHDLS